MRLVKAKCKRCGEELLTCDRPQYGAVKTYEKWGQICQDCMTPEEVVQMDKDFQTEVFGFIEGGNN